MKSYKLFLKLSVYFRFSHFFFFLQYTSKSQVPDPNIWSGKSMSEVVTFSFESQSQAAGPKLGKSM